ncbi:hypothetical protein GS889_14275 [Rhodococcus hoagii]|nr:hypothetical protein [Prescottella equi]
MSATDSLLTVLILAAIGNTLITALVLFNVKGVRVRLAIAPKRRRRNEPASPASAAKLLAGQEHLLQTALAHTTSATRGTPMTYPGPDPLEQRVQDLELRLAAAESMTDILVNEARLQRGLENRRLGSGCAQTQSRCRHHHRDRARRVGVEHPAAPSLTEQLQEEARATIQRVTGSQADEMGLKTYGINLATTSAPHSPAGHDRTPLLQRLRTKNQTTPSHTSAPGSGTADRHHHEGAQT